MIRRVVVVGVSKTWTSDLVEKTQSQKKKGFTLIVSIVNVFFKYGRQVPHKTKGMTVKVDFQSRIFMTQGYLILHHLRGQGTMPKHDIDVYFNDPARMKKRSNVNNF